jgi:ribonuclease E
MAKRMLIDAAHPEETRVVVLSGNRLEEFDFESSTKKQVKGNIYLAKVTRVEPSLQAAFVEYGGNRHGFLAFSEIHPDYYRIPVSDRRDVGYAAEPDSVSETVTNGLDANSVDEGVPIAAALPEPVTVPEGSLEDESGAEDEPVEVPMAAVDAEYGHVPDAEPVVNAPESDVEGEPIDVAAQPEAITAEHAEAPTEEAPQEAAPAMPDPAPPAVSDAVELAPTAEIVPALAVPPEIPAESTPLEVALVEPEASASEPLASEPTVTPYHEVVAADRENVIEASETEPHEPRALALASEDEMLVGGEFVVSDTENGADDDEAAKAEIVETFGGDEMEEAEAEAEHRRSRSLRHYKIQEVVKRRQIMLVQVAKEERGNKGAALTTYLSLAGRYCVLMPNTGRGGGVSRKITHMGDRRRLKEILEDLDIPDGMGVIVRTAGAERSKAEIKRDYEYLLRLWNEIRALTLESTAPALIYEEGNLIKRSIRDLYARDIDEVLVEGEEGYRTAKAFMRTLMPSHAKHVQPYRDPQVGLFHRFQVESQIDAVHSPVAQLRSGGYVVINQTEALVAIDVNSGRSTRERNIEETALRTNLEAADEIARQLRLRDLAGLIVIDFIDMEEHRNQIAVERRLKEALKNDRARIQVGRISPFGLLEMSRQRLRPSLAEASTQPCPHCAGTGFIRSVESAALYVLRSIEEEGIRRRSAEICIYVPTTVALYILNQKRESLSQIESRYGIKVMVARDDALIPPNFRLERLRAFAAGEPPAYRSIQAPAEEAEFEDEDDEEVEADAEGVEPGVEANEATEGEEERGRRRRRRRRRRPDEAREGRAVPVSAGSGADEAGAENGFDGGEERTRPGDVDGDGDGDRRRRRRGRRGGRIRGRRDDAAGIMEVPIAAAQSIEIVPPIEDERIAAEAAMAEPRSPWPEDSGVETASLAPLAGDTGEIPVEHLEAHEPEPPVETAPTAEAEEGIPYISEAEQAPEPALVEHRENGEELAPPVRAPKQPDPNEEVLTVTEKPANPRRGWWQRLMQS